MIRYLSFAILPVLLPGLLFAAPETTEGKKSSLAFWQKKPKSTATGAPCKNSCNYVNESRASCSKYENNIFVEADLIYWIAKQEGNSYAATGAAITVPGTADPITGLVPGSLESGSIYAPNIEFRPGFKVGLGINLAHGGWDLFTNYTYFFSKAHRSVQSDDLNSSIIPIFGYGPNNSILAETTYESGANGFVSEATASWDLHFNNINLELGKLFQTCSAWRLWMHPHFGLEASWQKQKLNVNYEVSAISPAGTFLGNNQALFDQTFWGVGPRTGLDTTWECCNHLGLFADTAFALLWGQFSSHAKSYDTNTLLSYENILIANQSYRPYTMSPVIQVDLGVESAWLFGNTSGLVVRLGWEAQVWFFQNQHSTPIADTSLILQGLTADFRFNF